MNIIAESQFLPLEVDEVIQFLKKRWGVTYEMRIVWKGKKGFLQIMWRYLEQQSFALNEKEYREKLALVIDIINRTDQTSEVRYWLLNVQGRPRSGRALSLPLRRSESFEEFVI